jgi:hypothetical protein
VDSWVSLQKTTVFYANRNQSHATLVAVHTRLADGRFCEVRA